MKIINKINPRISAFKFKDEVRGFLTNNQLKNEKILAFYPNCSLDEKGHSAVGWMEYKRSEDYGETWSQPYIFQSSLKLLHSEMKYSAMCEKAIVNEKGDIIVYQLICDISNDPQWQPYMVPSYSISRDKGSTWSNLRQIGTRRGRIYDAMYQEGTIFLLLFVNDATVDWTGQTTDHYYSLVVSEDGGELLDALFFHTLLKDSLPDFFVGEEEYDYQAVSDGARTAQKNSFTSAVFKTRIYQKYVHEDKKKAANFLLGVLMYYDCLSICEFKKTEALEEVQFVIVGKRIIAQAVYDILTDIMQEKKVHLLDEDELMAAKGAFRLAELYYKWKEGE